jgi:uncharacterized protein YjiS (DUF1127 family)
MFYRTSEYDAAFGVQTATSPAPEPIEFPNETVSPWRAAVRVIGNLAQSVASAHRQRRAHRAALLAVDRLDDHMLRDIGLSRRDYGALGIDAAFRSLSRIEPRR